MTARSPNAPRTVDLAHVLADFGLRFRFLTRTVGVDPSYRAEPFYKPTLDADSVRVNQLFERAAERDIVIENRSLKAEELASLVRPQSHMVMALVDRRHLYRQPTDTLSGFVDSVVTHCFSGYVGHYVLLTGYDDVRCGYYVMDPAKTAQAEFVPASALEAARRSHGTDEDLLVIPWEQPERRRVSPRLAAVSAAA